MRLLVDTSVWIDHFHRADAALRAGSVWTHAVVIGELAAGRLARRREVITLLRKLPGADEIDHCLRRTRDRALRAAAARPELTYTQ